MSLKSRVEKLERARGINRMPQPNNEPTVTLELPKERWAEQYSGLRTVPASYLADLEKIYGAEARTRGESAVVTYLRYAAWAGDPEGIGSPYRERSHIEIASGETREPFYDITQQG